MISLLRSLLFSCLTSHLTPKSGCYGTHTTPTQARILTPRNTLLSSSSPINLNIYILSESQEYLGPGSIPQTLSSTMMANRVCNTPPYPLIPSPFFNWLDTPPTMLHDPSYHNTLTPTPKSASMFYLNPLQPYPNPPAFPNSNLHPYHQSQSSSHRIFPNYLSPYCHSTRTPTLTTALQTTLDPSVHTSVTFIHTFISRSAISNNPIPI